SLSSPSPLALELTAEDVDCNAAVGLGLLSLSVTGGTPPYEVFLNDELVVTSPSYQRPPGTYTARIIDAQGCEIVANPVPIRAPEEFLGALRPNQTILTLGNSTTVRLQSNRSLGAAQIIWEPASWVSCQNCSETTIRPRSSGVLRAFLTDEDGCQAQDAVLIQVIPDQSVYLPTAISPNGDGVNDVFRAYAGPAVQEVLSLSVYDRWGGLYFHGKGEGAQWAPGSEAATGLYIYQLEVLFLNGMKELLRGGVMLMR
ncbi:MAG: gliding motility-associated C-terminal domain-containing protein, partial [Bacteroidota bacterium]